MALSPSPWQLTLARIEGALPFISPELSECLAMASLRRLWRVHVRDYPFDNLGIAHNPGVGASELVRSWYAEERRQFLSWIGRRAPPALAKAAKLVLAAKSQAEGFTEAYTPADNALARLDALLPSRDPQGTLLEWLEELRTEEFDFFEGGSEMVQVGGFAITRSAPRGAAWAASLAAAIRPHLFGLGSAPLALAGIMPRALFREFHEEPLPALLRSALQTATDNAAADLRVMREAVTLADKQLAGRLYASSTAPQVWRMIVSLGPLTRAELARCLGVTKRTASQSVSSLQEAGMVRLRETDSAIVPANADLVPRE
ncbi:MarR family transcriptional regulator [Novosphingobium sp.]|jgi:DNA-binding transcriptional ArsR family regulator|uniref:MarR family transcriptional regulator n=2 Tax=unclassified Novosphingobium TaxID=2644732 RepID=UPI00262B3801|nr:MarR family transcriptional regulator [Novosphingobium sp.]